MIFNYRACYINNIMNGRTFLKRSYMEYAHKQLIKYIVLKRASSSGWCMHRPATGLAGEGICTIHRIARTARQRPLY